MPFKLQRTRQCKKCPWKVSTNPHEIPNGYSLELHQGLADTIAQPADFSGAFCETRRVFACHESPVGSEAYCIGWLMNQLGNGNNIGLRLKMRDCENLGDVQLDGPQHACFEDTFPGAADHIEADGRAFSSASDVPMSSVSTAGVK